MISRVSIIRKPPPQTLCDPRRGVCIIFFRCIPFPELRAGEVQLRAFILLRDQGGFTGRALRQVREELLEHFLSQELFHGGDGKEHHLEGILASLIHPAGHLRVIREAAVGPAGNDFPAGETFPLQGGGQGIILHRAGPEHQLLQPGQDAGHVLRRHELRIPEFPAGEGELALRQHAALRPGGTEAALVAGGVFAFAGGGLTGPGKQVIQPVIQILHCHPVLGIIANSDVRSGMEKNTGALIYKASWLCD